MNDPHMEIRIRSRDFWVKVVEMLQQNWALIDQDDESGGGTVYFISDRSEVFDRIPFRSSRHAFAELRYNGFVRFSESNELSEFLAPPNAPFYEGRHPNGLIYSSGRFWESPFPTELNSKEVDRINLFESICELAIQKQWCWNILCTTCGHMYFRYGFVQIAKGISPNSADWIDPENTAECGTRHGNLSEVTREITDNKVLYKYFQEADLAAISGRVKVPDFLGYLGLALRYSRGLERRHRRLTDAWVSQLSTFICRYSSAESYLKMLESDPSRTLTWEGLSIVERSWGPQNQF